MPGFYCLCFMCMNRKQSHEKTFWILLLLLLYSGNYVIFVQVVWRLFYDTIWPSKRKRSNALRKTSRENAWINLCLQTETETIRTQFLVSSLLENVFMEIGIVLLLDFQSILIRRPLIDSEIKNIHWANVGKSVECPFNLKTWGLC